LEGFEHAAERLLNWYDEHKRVLPWREEPSPYHVWISEIMLQQTRAEAVKAYYRRFLAALPDIPALAAADEDLCMKLWEGLGYYSRVRNLQKAAKCIMADHGGQMPDTYEELLRLPGIGPYTAAAIASIAFGRAVPAVDGNLQRIYARLTADGSDQRLPEAKKKASAFYSALIPAGRPGDFNQALMDLGSAVCVPNTLPVCGSCPLKECCQACLRGETASYPFLSPKKERRIENRTVFLIHDADRIVLRKRPAKGLLAGLYEYPNTQGHLPREEALAFIQSLGLSPLRLTPLEPSVHIFTHIEWHMSAYEVRTDEFRPFTENEAGYFSASLSDIAGRYAIPGAFAVYTAHILKGVEKE